MKTFLMLSSVTMLLVGCDCGPMDGDLPAAYQTPSNAAYTQQQLEQAQEPGEPTFMLPDQ
jgi:hypothetical protein